VTGTVQPIDPTVTGRPGVAVALSVPAMVAVFTQADPVEAATLAVTTPVLIFLAARRLFGAVALRAALAAAVAAVLVTALLAPAVALTTAVGAVAAGSVFAALHRLAPDGSSPGPVLVAIVVGGLAGPFSPAWAVLSLGLGLLVNGAVAAVVLLIDDRPGRTTPMTATLVGCTLAVVLARTGWSG
jgi:hypothetical protein